MRVLGLLMCLLLCASVAPSSFAQSSKRRNPNIIFILADDLGYGDIGPYGQTRIKTPHLDRLAREGVRFTDFYAASPVCAPSRASLMTGQHQGHAFVRGNTTKVPVPGQTGAAARRLPLRPGDVTVAEVLKGAGYATGVIGKWGLGEPGTTGVPDRQGFDYFFGYLNQTHAHSHFPEYLWRNRERVELPKGTYSQDLFTEEALQFIRRERGRPFFLYLAYIIPHANNELGRETGNGIEVKTDAPYTGEPWPQQQKNYAASVTRMDADIGRLMSLLKELGIDRDTVVLFSSDNGPQGRAEGGFDPDFFRSHGPLRGIKRDLYEGGLRVPLVARWPGRIGAGRTSRVAWANYDFLPTAAAIAGARAPRDIDGVSMLPALLGQRPPARPHLYFEFHEGEFAQAVRLGRWKAVRKSSTRRVELYDLQADIGETTDVAARHPLVVRRVEQIMRAERTESEFWPVESETESAASLSSSTSSPKTRRYNVLFISSDDLRPELGAYGVARIKTPNIDRLAARGVRFDRAYAQYPLCNPSRTSLLTGRHPSTTGVMDNNTYFRVKHPDWVTLPQHFKQHGYAALRSGKIFHGGIDDQVSWTEGGEPTDPAITERGTNRRPAQPRRDPEAEGEPNAAPPTQQAPRPTQQADRSGNPQSDRIVVLEGEGERHGDYRTATRAIQYLEKYRDRPFFLSVGFVKPHSPPTAPKKFFDLYDVNDMQLPRDFATRPAAPPGFPTLSVPPRNTDLFVGRDASPEEAREMMRAYYASTSFMDAQVGRVLDALDRLGLREKTVVVFWGDHGYHLGEKGKWSKAYSLFEVAARVPLVVAVPGARGGASTRLVQLLDLYPTLAELCGLPAPQGVEGRSLAALLRNPDARWNHPAYTVTMYRDRVGKSVRTDRWRYAEWEEGREGAMLFDHTRDPHELRNLASDPAHAKTVREMKSLLKKLP